MATRASEVRDSGQRPGSYAELDDRLLVLDFQAGNEEPAYEEIHRRYAGLAHHVCRRILGSADDADEAAQETMLRVYQGLSRFNGRYAVQPWVARIATNVSLDVVRARARRPQVADTSLVEHALGGEHALGEDPLELLERSLERERVNAVLEELPPHHRDALVLREFEGRSHEEIGEALGVTPPQAKALIHRAKGSFRRAWRRGEYGRGFAALVPIILAPFRLPQALRRLFLPVSEGVAGSAASQAAASAAASPAAVTTATSTIERVTTAAVAVLTAATVAVGATVAVHKVRDGKEASPSPSAVVVAPPTQAPQVEPPPVVIKTVRVQTSKHDPKAAAASTPETSVEPTPPPPESSPPPSGSPSPPPTLPPAPPWSLSFESSVPLGLWQPAPVTSRVSGTAGHDLTFSQTVAGPTLTADGDTTGRLYIEYFGWAGGPRGSVQLWIILDTPDGRYRYDAGGTLVALTVADSGAVDYTFTGDYYMVEWPASDDDDASAADPAPALHDGAFQLDLGFWADGTTLYEAGISLQEPLPSPSP